MADIVIRNGEIVDGTLAPAFVGDSASQNPQPLGSAGSPFPRLSPLSRCCGRAPSMPLSVP